MADDLPKSELGSKEVLLSPIDNVMPRVRLLRFIFVPVENADQARITQELTSGLQTLLQEFPILTGTIQDVQESESGARRGRLKVVFPKFKLTDLLSFSDLTDRSELDYRTLREAQFPMSKLSYDTLFPALTFKNDEIGLKQSVLMVQVSFVPHGLIIARSMHHSFTDGFGTVTVLNMWATLCRGESIDSAIKDDFSDRNRLLPTGEPVDLSEFKEFKLKPMPVQDIAVQKRPQCFWTYAKNLEVAISKGWIYAAGMPKLLRQTLYPSTHKREKSASPPKTVSEMFFFPQIKLDELKRTVIAQPLENEEAIKAPYVSTNDVLAALIFVYINSARISPKKRPTPPTFPLSMAVSARDRLSPPLPDGYIGNTAVFIHLDFSLEDATTMSIPNISKVARGVRGKILEHNPERIQRNINAFDQVDDPRRVTMKCFESRHFPYFMTSVSGQKYYNFKWGSAIGVGCERIRTGLASPQGFIVVHPRLQGHSNDAENGLEVGISLEEDAMVRLKELKDWSKWCEWRCA